MAPQVKGGIHYPGDAWLAPQAFMLWLTRAAQAAGVEIRHQCEAYDLDRKGERVTAVDTTLGRFGGDQVVLATGAWLPELTAGLGKRVLVEGAKGYSVTFEPTAGIPRLPLDLEERGAVVVPLKNRLRIIFSLELGCRDLSIDPRRLAPIPGLARDYLPHTAWGRPTEVRRGIRPVSADGLPIGGRLPGVENVFVVGGHDQKGLSLGPGAGYRLARQIAGRPPDTLDRLLAPDRFFA